MNYYLAFFFLACGLLVLIKPLYSYLFSNLVGSKVKISGYLALFFGIILFLTGLLQPEWSDRLWSVIFVVMGALSFLKGVWLIALPNHASKILEIFIKHYYKITVPVSILYLFISVTVVSTDYIGPQKDISKCESDDRIKVICGFSNPEDIVITPDNKFFFISEFGGIGPYAEHTPGYFALMDLNTYEKKVPKITFGESSWGDASCIRGELDIFNPHGIDLVENDEGFYQLAVINHSPFESIEMFEIIKNESSWDMIWRGCIRVPDQYYFNDVALKKDGSFYASHMYKRDISMEEWLMNSLFKSISGHVVLWSDNNFNKVDGTDGSGPNGILLDEGSGLLYVNYNQGDNLSVYDINQNTKTGSYFIQSPDNIFLKDGSVWLTSLDLQANDFGDCAEKTNCSLPFSIHKLNQKTLKREDKFSFSRTVFGLPTIAVPHDEKIFMGSFHSDRIGYFSEE